MEVPERYRLTEEDLKAMGFGGAEPAMSLAHRVANAAAEKAVREALKDVGDWLDKPCCQNEAVERKRCLPCIARLRLALAEGRMPGEDEGFFDDECPLCGKPLHGETGVHKACADYEQWRSDPASLRSGKAKEG